MMKLLEGFQKRAAAIGLIKKVTRKAIPKGKKVSRMVQEHGADAAQSGTSVYLDYKNNNKEK